MNSVRHKARPAPQVSVLMSCYNAARWLGEAIDSVLAQTFDDFEFIVVDDGSSDETAAIVRRYADSRILLVSKANSGLADSLNVGLARARGRWVARLDADDVCEPERLARQVEFAGRHPRVVLLGTGHVAIDEAGHVIAHRQYPSSHRALVRRLERIRPMFTHSSAMFSFEAAQRIGGYNPSYRKSQDWDYWNRFAESGRVACLPECLVRVRVHGGQISSSTVGLSQRVYGMAASTCHFLRQLGAEDPSVAGGKLAWQDFVGWVQNRMKQEGVFERLQVWDDARAGYQTQPGRVSAGLVMGRRLLASGRARAVLAERFLGASLPRQLALEWMNRSCAE